MTPPQAHPETVTAQAPWRRPKEFALPRTSGQQTVLPTAPAQRRMLFMHQMAPQSPVYNVALPLTVRGGLVLDRLEAALTALERRHEVLRTTFEERGGEFVQIVHGEDSAPSHTLTVISPPHHLHGKTARRDFAVVEAIRHAEIPYDLGRGPLWRAVVIEVDAQEHVLLVGFHHIIIDELSIPLLAGELAELYGDRTALDERPRGLQYADYCLWQKDTPLDPTRLEYWRRTLCDLEPLRLPGAGASPSVAADSFDGDQVLLDVPAPVVELIETAGRRLGASPFMVLLGVLAVLLRRATGQPDIPMGSIITSRPDPEFAHTIGFFSNTVVLRVPVSLDASFRALLATVRAVVLGAIEHHDVPFETVVEAVRPQRDPGKNPLFDVGLVYNRQRAESVWRLPGLDVAPLPFPWRSAHFGLMLVFNREPSGALSGSLTFRTAQLSRDLAECLAERFLWLLGQLLETPDAPVGEIPLLSPEAEQKILALGTGEVARWRGERSAWNQFVAIARAQPEKTAFEAEDGMLSFAALCDWAEAWGSALSARGVSPENVVALCLPRRAALIAAALATWRAQGAFLLLDPAAPAARLELLCAEAGVSLVLIEGEPPAWLQGSTLNVLPLAALPRAPKPAAWTPGGQTPAAALHRPAETTGNELAYVMFTSGSTGRPKGVMIEQRSVVAHVETQMAPLYAAAEATAERPLRVGALSAVTFDVFIHQFLSMAGLGHTLVLLTEEERLDPVALVKRNAERATALNVVFAATSQIELLVDAGLLETRHPPALLLMGGEAISGRLWQRLQAAPRTRSFNLYGTTETTIHSTSVDIQEQSLPSAGRAAGVGRLYIVDAALRLLPPGFIGELCVGGDGVGRGYLGTAGPGTERFMTDPFSSDPGARLYRTGDRARLRLDGQLEFLGRLDDQLKVRGLRIEPAEIEAALGAHPAISQAAVVLTQGPSGDVLVAFIVAATGADPNELTPARIKDVLRHRLPSALWPDRIERIDALPLTRHGKVDRAELRQRAQLDPGGDRAALLSQAATSPASEGTEALWAAGGEPSSLETKLCRILAELLGVPRVQPHEDFFALGGHSLLALRAALRLARELGHHLTLSTFIAHPSARALASHLLAQGGAPVTGLTQLRAGQGAGTLVLFHPVGGALSCYEPLVSALAPGPTVLGCERHPHARRRDATLGEFIERYARSVQEAVPKGALFLGGWSMGGLLAYLVGVHLLGRGREVRRIELIDTLATSTPADRDALRQSGRVLAAFSARIREQHSLSAGSQAESAHLVWLGLHPEAFLALAPEDAAALLEDCAHLLALCAEAALPPMPTPTHTKVRLFWASENPETTARHIRTSWQGLCPALAIAVPGDHGSVLRPPAVFSVAEALTQDPV
jgi:amino acid adenylation domain-containing protein